jgi:hypothetical protein
LTEPIFPFAAKCDPAWCSKCDRWKDIIRNPSSKAVYDTSGQ